MNATTHSHIATLTHGQNYTVLGPNSGAETVFRNGIGIPISADMKRFLEAEAVDEICVTEGNRKKSYRTIGKFTFSPITPAD